MTIRYPEITWIDQDPQRRWKGSALGYEFDVRYQAGGKWQGYWTAIVNHGAIQTGSGEFGYLFPSAEAAKTAAETEMKLRIDRRVDEAQKVLASYTV